MRGWAELPFYISLSDGFCDANYKKIYSLGSAYTSHLLNFPLPRENSPPPPQNNNNFQIMLLEFSSQNKTDTKYY